MQTLILALAVVAAPQFVRAEERPWIELMPVKKPLDAWKGPTDDWMSAADAELDPRNGRKLAPKPGEGIVINSPKGRARDLYTREEFGDVEVHVEFMIPRGSNSGVKLMGLYEIQIIDSYGRPKEKLTGGDCGGIYPKAEDRPSYHYINDGTPPRTNACKPPGEWQTFDIIFQAPRFDADGKKTVNARFVKVVFNGEVIHENAPAEYPTGTAWRTKKEVARGPLMLQGDHGPVAFRNVRIRPYESTNK